MGRINSLNQEDGVRRFSGFVSRRRFLSQALAAGGGLYILDLEKSVAAGKENKSGKMKLIGKVRPQFGRRSPSPPSVWVLKPWTGSCFCRERPMMLWPALG